MFTFAFISQIILLVYFEVTTLINLYPWNDLSKYTRKEKITEATVNGITIIIGITLFISKKPVLMVIATIFWFLFLLVQLLNWWMPYITGKHLKQFPRELYDSHFQDTLKILPPIKEHIIPDAQHNVLQFLSLEVFIVSLLAIIN
ncbi:MAG TPA: hypothetical protein VK061_00545 [Bacillota bacterium]|nr:hypothetical protein [Bacillota bacterium]